MRTDLPAGRAVTSAVRGRDHDSGAVFYVFTEMEQARWATTLKAAQPVILDAYQDFSNWVRSTLVVSFNFLPLSSGIGCGRAMAVPVLGGLVPVSISYIFAATPMCSASCSS